MSSPPSSPKGPMFILFQFGLGAGGRGQREGEDFFSLSRKTWNKFF
jgi:hypothetical protein